MKIIKSIENIDILVDDDDYEFLNQFTWTIIKNNYVSIKDKKGYKFNTRFLHRIIMNPPKDKHIDHIDGNPLNNTRENLRICTPSENARNRKLQKEYNGKLTSSKYKGVNWLKKVHKWRVEIRYPTNGKIYLGLFDNEIAAANCYNYWAKFYYKEFAKLNDVSYMTREEWEKLKINNQTSQYTGVCWDNRKQKWLAQVWNGELQKNIRIGYFDDEIEAAKAYNEMAVKIKGVKAKLNII